MKEFFQNNWAWLLVASFIILLVYSIMRISKRNDDGKWENEDEDNEDNHISGDVIDMTYCKGVLEDDDILGHVN